MAIENQKSQIKNYKDQTFPIADCRFSIGFSGVASQTHNGNRKSKITNQKLHQTFPIADCRLSIGYAGVASQTHNGNRKSKITNQKLQRSFKFSP
jgi:hypothetical protein